MTEPSHGGACEKSLETLIECRTCGAEHPHATELTDEGRFRFACTGCGTSFSP